MAFGVHRRDFLKASAGGVIGAALPFGLFDAEASPKFAINELGRDLFLISGAGANVVAGRKGDKTVMVDGGSPKNAKHLVRFVHKHLKTHKIDVLFNTHWHHNHTGSNLELGKAGAKIVAHENTRLWLTTDVTRPWEKDITFKPLPKIAQPNATFYVGGEEPFGGEKLQYGYMLQAHTDGDMFVYFPQENVLVTGGVVSGDGWPLVDWWTGGWINGMVDGLGRLIGVADDSTKIVTANGGVMSRADLLALHDMFKTISGRLIKMLNDGLGPDEAVAAAPTKEFDAKMGDPKKFVTLAFESLWGHFSPDA